MAFLSNTHAHAAKPRRATSLLGLVTLYRQRRALTRLDAAALADLGISRTEARQEARRPVWDVPCHWVK